MEESFESRPLIERDILRALQQRQDASSLTHLALHLGAFLLGIVLVIVTADRPVVAFFCTVLLAAIWATLFAPFHECTHQTAFQSRQLNMLGTWLTGIPFGMAPAFYRAFHFQHHRYTHDPERDPEIGGGPQLDVWPTTPTAWLSLISGLWLCKLKAVTLFQVSRLSTTQGEPIAPWISAEQRPQVIKETRIVAAAWLGLVIATLVGIRGAGWLLLALILSHLFQAVWLSTEHTGLPHAGTILGRTRTMQVAPFVRWWLWNMNYHAEHHAWPAVPWDKLPMLHERVAGHLEHQARGYWQLQLDVLQQHNLPDGTSMQSSGHARAAG
jgi:fatty acid desaturase